jgi:hypothetical protein
MYYKSKQKIDNALQNIVKGNEDGLEQALNSIIDQLPEPFKNLIEYNFIHKRIPKEYLLSSISFAVSCATGLTFFVKELGYTNYANSYFAIVGSRGDAKSEAIKIATSPIKSSDDRDYDQYLSNKNMESEEDPAVSRKQVLLQNASIEAAQKIHAENPNSIGLCMDEIFALVDKMSNPNSRDGIAWRNFFLEGYTNGHIDISRKTTESFRIKETSPALIGGLQHQFLPKLFANGNLESGFIDRLFFTTLITTNDKLTYGEIDPKITEIYEVAINNILNYKKQSELPHEIKKQFEICFTESASKLLFKYTQELIDRKSSAPPMIKEYCAKMQISIQKLCIQVFMMRHAFESTFASNLTEANVELAIELNEFYFLNFQKIIEDNFKQKEKTLSADDIIKLAKKNNASQKAVTEVTGLSKGTISKKWNKQ